MIREAVKSIKKTSAFEKGKTRRRCASRSPSRFGQNRRCRSYHLIVTAVVPDRSLALPEIP
jgi:hypothetical protein